MDIKKSQDSMKRMFESKLEKFRSDLMESIDTKIRALRDELSMDINRESYRLEQVAKTVQAMQSRITTIEQTTSSRQTDENKSRDSTDQHKHGQFNPSDDPDLTVTASGIKYTEGEDLMAVAHDLISALGDDVSLNVLITSVSRLPTRYVNRPPLVKISFQNVDEKILVLRHKMALKDIDRYKEVYIKSYKSRIERLIEMNARAILKELPQGNTLRVNANGRIMHRVQQDDKQK
jgi:hypothetical protein